MASLRVALLLAIAQTARARSATLAAIASNADYANRLYGPSHAVDPAKLRVVSAGRLATAPRRGAKTILATKSTPLI